MGKTAADVIKFWDDAGPKAWFSKDDEFDQAMADQFMVLHGEIAARQHDDWRKDAEGCLALVLVMDQFSRNMFRNDPRSFSQDEYAVELANFALEQGYDKLEPQRLYTFLHMPYMHSEDLAEQERCVELFAARGEEAQGGHKFAIIHRDIVAKFGRFPHRNEVLGRTTTPAEQAFLDDGGFSG